MALFLTLSFSEVRADELSSLEIKTNFNIWNPNLRWYDLLGTESHTIWNDFDIEISNKVSSELSEIINSQIKVVEEKTISYDRFQNYLDKYVAPDINREKQDVTIDLDEEGRVLFEGFAISGQEIDYQKAYYVAKEAFKNGVEAFRLPIHSISPEVVINNDELIDKGITHLLATGETDFAGSPYNRINNIDVGLTSFNGKIIAPGQQSGAGDILGRIDETTGYKKELVIKGDKTIPEYGGGLCQVSTTVYRGLLFAGIPITQRRNHSYAVSYYDPQGLDATIYPPYVDMKFLNDTEGHLLIQTMTTKEGKAFANIYGTPTDRYVDLVGPYYYDHKKAPAPRTEYTTELKPGEKQVVGGEHDGFKASWYRRIITAEDEKVEHIFSNYQARPLYTLVGEEVNQSTEVVD